MNKLLLTIATVGLLILFSSAYYTAPTDSRVGCKAPSLVLDNNNGLSPLQQHRGANILLTFWSSDDASSRLDNIRYDRLSKDEHAAFTHVSVNMDRSEGVFDAVVAIDNLDRSAQFGTSAAVQDDIIKSWRLEDGFHTFLINSKGEIIDVDPDAATLARLK